MLLIRGSAGHWYEAQLAGQIWLLIRGSVDHWYEAQWEGYAADTRLSRPLIRGSVGGVDSTILIRGSVDHWYEAQWEGYAADTRLSRPLIRGSVGGVDLATDMRLSRPLIRGSAGRLRCWYDAQQATDMRLSERGWWLIWGLVGNNENLCYTRLREVWCQAWIGLMPHLQGSDARLRGVWCQTYRGVWGNLCYAKLGVRGKVDLMAWERK